MAKSETPPNTGKAPRTAAAGIRAAGRKRSDAPSAATSTVNNQPKKRVLKGKGSWVPPADEVALRAYELYLERGRAHGHDLEDWIEAERQVRARYAR